MLRSAAMTLLSKTLLTFLYKYLSDVDVEGIEMPSLYGSTDGQSSGWGVRLSNVKLREGAELMVLPGGRKGKEKPSKPRDPGDNSTVASKDTKDSKASAKKPRLAKKKSARKIDAAADKTAKGEEKQNGNRNGSNTSSATIDATEEKSTNATMKGALSVETSSTSIADESLPKELLELSDAETLASIEDDMDGSTRPETPTQSNGLFSCFGPNQKDKVKAANGRAAGQREQESNISSDTPSQEEREDESRQYSKDSNGNDHHQMNGGHGAMNGDGKEMDTKALCDAIQQGIDEQLPEIPDLYDEEDEKDVEDLKDGDDAEEEEDDEEDDTPPMALRIGEGGYIGTLDVRLVGRELHVLVEDAFLCLEAVRKEVVPDKPATPKASAEADANTDNHHPTEPPEKKPAATPTAAPVDINELKTTGERVLAKNSMARIFSSIPHLFLRDITVRLIVKGEKGDSTEDANENGNSQANREGDETEENDSAGAIVDIGIGLLSVTEGDEFVSPFNEDPDGDDISTQDGEEFEEYAPPPSVMERTSHNGPSPDNEYLQRRIRTGKGADGGLWLNIVIPKYEEESKRHFASNGHATVPHAMEHRWARHAWLESTRHCVLRLSGLDIQARIFLGTKKELALASGSSFWSYDDVSTYDGIDHTLYGFDHVVPGPTPNTLPPLNPAPHCSAGRSMEEGDDNGNLRSQVYRTDRNGIQSSQIESCFYRVARGMTPVRCTLEHLPCENCLKCWEASGKRTCEPIPVESHILDSYTPMPGLALSISIRDPLEMNVDRVSLDGLGLVIGLFKKKPVAAEPAAEETPDEEADAPEDEAPVAEVVADPEASQSYFSYFFGSSKAEDGDGSRRFSLLSPRKAKPKPPAFPKCMKPENVDIMGVFVAEIRLRVHVMKEDDEQRHNTGLSFCYWDLKGDCLTMDQQKLNSEDKTFSDLRLDLGMLEMNEFKGVGKKILVSAGVPCPTGEFVSLEALSSRPKGRRPPWPTIASALLDVPATVESMVYENRERHGVQLRMLAVVDRPGSAVEKSRTLINCQLGPLEMNLPFKIGGLIGEIKREAMKSLGSEPAVANAEPPDPGAAKKDSATQYRAQLGGGRVRMTPSLDVRLPLTRLAGNICPESGFSMETLLERVEFSWGENSKKVVPTANSAQGVSLKRFASLPEPIRLRILLFLDDLAPLEKALGVKQQANSFLRCNAVNKGFGKLTKPKKKKSTDSSSQQPSSNRRQQLMNKLLTLDDDALEHLWASHQRKQRKVNKTNSSSKKAR